MREIIPKSCLRRFSFTLIELLVVMAIIAMLFSLLMPALSKARTKAGEIECKSNLMNLGAALSMYAQEFEQMPSHCARGNAGRCWAQNLLPYLGDPNLETGRGNKPSTKVFLCSKKPTVNRMRCAVGASYTDPINPFIYRSYGWNLNLDCKVWESIAEASKTIAISDSNYGIGWIGLGNKHHGSYYHGVTCACRSRYGNLAPRHGGGVWKLDTDPGSRGDRYEWSFDGLCNICWVDGHVSSRTGYEILGHKEWGLPYK